MAEGFDFNELVKAFEARDADRVLAFFADDVEIYSDDLDQPLRGKELIEGLVRRAMPAMSEVRVKPVSVLQRGDQFAALMEFTVRYGQDLDFPGWVHLPLAGRSATLRGALFATLNEAGKMVTVYRIRDTWSAMKQLGLTPEQLERIKEQLVQAPPPA